MKKAPHFRALLYITKIHVQNIRGEAICTTDSSASLDKNWSSV